MDDSRYEGAIFDDPIISDAMKADIGVEWDVWTQTVDKRWIYRFAEAIEDDNPLYSDEVAARNSRFGGIIAPPTFYCALDPKWRHGEALERWRSPGKRKGGGGNAYDEVEFFEPIRAGDTITARIKTSAIYVRQGRNGKLLFNEREVTFTNQLGQLVAKCRGASVGVYE